MVADKISGDGYQVRLLLVDQFNDVKQMVAGERRVGMQIADLDQAVAVKLRRQPRQDQADVF